MNWTKLYRVARRLPDIEKFALANQIRRAAVSLTNNIAEAHGRYHYLDQMKFMRQSRGSLQELIDDLNVCADDEQYLPVEEIASLKEEGWRVRQLIDGYIRYLRDQKNSMGTASCERRRQQMTMLTNKTTIHEARFNELR